MYRLQENKNTDTTKNLEFMPIRTAKKRYQHLHTDLVGPIKDRDKLFLFQLTIDRFSRYTWTDPLKAMLTAQKIFENIKKNLGTNIKDTKSITTDRCPQFSSHHWAKTLKTLKIEKHVASANHPPTDGLAERVICPILTKMRIIS
jgi:transposase InsO family protein